MNSSSAYEYEYEYVKKTKPVERKKSHSLHALYVLLLFMFVGSLVLVVSFCTVHSKANSIMMKQNELSKLKDENVTLEEDLSCKFDLQTVNDIAKNKLGMHKPMPYQIVHISKPKQNYIIKYR